MKYFKIGFSCGCGDNEEYTICPDLDIAEQLAYEWAIEDYQSFEGLHGVLSIEDIAEEMFSTIYEGEDGLVDLDRLTDKDWEEVEARYRDEIETTIDYWAEEITEKEYLIGIGELEDDDE